MTFLEAVEKALDQGISVEFVKNEGILQIRLKMLVPALAGTPKWPMAPYIHHSFEARHLTDSVMMEAMMRRINDKLNEELAEAGLS